MKLCRYWSTKIHLRIKHPKGFRKKILKITQFQIGKVQLFQVIYDVLILVSVLLVLARLLFVETTSSSLPFSSLSLSLARACPF